VLDQPGEGAMAPAKTQPTSPAEITGRKSPLKLKTLQSNRHAIMRRNTPEAEARIHWGRQRATAAAIDTATAVRPSAASFARGPAVWLSCRLVSKDMQCEP